MIETVDAKESKKFVPFVQFDIDDDDDDDDDDDIHLYLHIYLYKPFI